MSIPMAPSTSNTSQNSFETADGREETSGLNCAKDSKSPGHTKELASFDPANLPPGSIIHHDNIYLAPVYHRTYRHIEVEEVERVTTIHKHIHHVQLHSQAVDDPTLIVNSKEDHFLLTDPSAENVLQANGIAGASGNNFVYLPESIGSTSTTTLRTNGAPVQQEFIAKAI